MLWETKQKKRKKVLENKIVGGILGVANKEANKNENNLNPQNHN